MKHTLTGYTIVDESDELVLHTDENGDNNSVEIPYFSTNDEVLSEIAKFYGWKVVPASFQY